MRWLASAITWLIAIDATSWVLGVSFWHAALIGVIAVLVEEILTDD